MSNYAALIDTLSISGSRLTDGSPNASGQVWFFQPGTNTPVNVYADAAATTIVTQPITLGAGGKLPTQYSAGVFATQPVRVYIQDASTNVVADNVWIPASAGDTGVNNAGFTDPTLDGVLTKALTSFGGQDWTYKESGGATTRLVQDKFRETRISVKDFGAKGDGVAIDTTAIQAAMSRAKALANTSTGLGSVSVWFPAGTYLIDQALTLTSAHVSIRGESFGSSQIKTSHASANVFSFASCSSFDISGLRINCINDNSGSGISLTDCTDVYVSGVLMDLLSSGLFLMPILAVKSTGSSSGITIERCSLTSQDTGAGRSIKLSSTTNVNVLNSYIHAGTAATGIELGGTTGDFQMYATSFTGSATAVSFASGLTGTRFRIFGNPSMGTAGFTTVFDLSALSTLPDFRQWGNNVDAVSFSAAIGNTLTPVLYKGEEIILSATSGGAGTQTVAVPAILPGTTATDVNLYWNFVFKNASGGAVTWSLNAAYVLNGATAIPATDGHTIQVRFRWDKATSKFRECSRGDTVT